MNLGFARRGRNGAISVAVMLSALSLVLPLQVIGCHAKRPLTWDQLAGVHRDHPTPPVDVKVNGPECVTMDRLSSPYDGVDPLPTSASESYLFGDNCVVRPVKDGASNVVVCDSSSGTAKSLPLAFGLWGTIEETLAALREPSLSTPQPEAIQRVYRITAVPLEWGSVLCVRYVQTGGGAFIVAKRIMGISQGGGYGDFYREYPRRQLSPDGAACVLEVAQRSGYRDLQAQPFDLQPDPDAWEYRWVLETFDERGYRVNVVKDLQPTSGVGLLFGFLLNLSGVDAN